MPCTGPVAYREFHRRGRMPRVRSRGADQVAPSSSLYWRCGVRSQGTSQLRPSARPLLVEAGWRGISGGLGRGGREGGEGGGGQRGDGGRGATVPGSAAGAGVRAGI